MPKGGGAGTYHASVTRAGASNERRVLGIILGAGLLVRLPFALFDARVSPDMGVFVTWAQTIADHGLVYLTDHVQVIVYPPLSMLAIGAAGVLASAAQSVLASGGDLLVFLIKLPPIAADIGLAWLIASLLRGHAPRIRLGAAALVAFNPALWYLSAVWGQTDSVYLFFGVAAVAALGTGAGAGAWSRYGLALATKVQPLALAPIMVIASLRRRGAGALAAGVAAAVAVPVVLLIPWFVGGGVPAYLGNLWGVTPRLDDSAANLWYAVYLGNTDALALASQHPLGLPVPAGVIGYLLLGAVVAVVCAAMWWRGPAVGLALPATILAMAPFMLLAGMRERYLLPALPFLLLLAADWDDVPHITGTWLGFAALTTTQTINLLAIAPPDASLWSGLFLDQTAGPLARAVEVLTLAAAAANSLLLAWLLAALARRALGRARAVQ
jgi:hypothetical protein